MTEQGTPKSRKLSYEILGLLGISLINAVVIFQILSMCSVAIIENYCFNNNLSLTSDNWVQIDTWVFTLSLLFAVGLFILLFLILLGDRLSFIRQIIEGIDALQTGQFGYSVPLEGNNELTQLAEKINYLSTTQQQIREKEQQLNGEKEELIRTLSHDIRTPLTSILAYSEHMDSRDDFTHDEQQEYVTLVRKKAEQIRDLTDILLDGGKRNPEHFSDARLLIEQLVAEFEESLEEEYTVSLDLTGCTAFSGTFDVQELRRITDNLVSNIQKYADNTHPVTLSIGIEDSELVIRQTNKKGSVKSTSESYRMGLNSIKRIAHNYNGRVDIRQDSELFDITIILSEF